ncbi:MAG TPA: flavin reductase family protein [Acidobacteriaceae bacterium]
MPEVSTPPDASSLQAHRQMRTFDPAISGMMEIYKLIAGLVVPRPVALVSTVDKDGVANVAPFSFFNAVGANPPTLLFCPMLRAEADHRADNRADTLRNIEQTGEFVINVVSHALAEAVGRTAADVHPDIDEFVLAGLTPRPSEVIRAPRVAESPASFECKLLQVIFTGTEPGAGVIVLGEILRIHVAEEVIDPTEGDSFHIDLEKLDAVGLMAGSTWVRTSDRFVLTRPR